MRSFSLALPLLLAMSASGLAAPTQCPALFLGGQAPEVANARMAPKTRELCYERFGLLHSGMTRTALWVGEHLTRSGVADAREMARVNAFHAEPRLPEGERAELSDYVRSGYDRGHLAPSGNMPDPDSQEQSFTLANMIPQDPDNNRNLWAAIETAVRDLAARSGELYVVTGPVFAGAELKSLRGRVLVPSHVFKAVYDPRSGKASAYLVENAPGNAWRTVSIQDLRTTTGIDVFPALPPQVKAILVDLPAPKARQSRQDRAAQAETGGAESLAKSIGKRIMGLW